MGQSTLALACVLAPLVGCALALVVLRRRHRSASAVVVLSGVVSFVAAGLLLVGFEGEAAAIASEWIVVGDVPIEFGVLLDGLTLIMGATVALITLLIQVYSLSYMSDDPGRGRFFAFLALFEWAMLMFVYAPSLLQMFVFWELVGLASFLLIGFWYEKPSAVAAAKKAFLMTRVGDVGFFVGLILLFGATGTLDIGAILGVFDPAGAPEGISAARVELIAALLFVGVIGKSAQFPLHTWLPDAMEGPTPVSALLHSATMVAAGVFLVARLHGLFLDAPATLMGVLVIASITALLASSMAMVAKDMKRVLAYSTVSQLSFMLLGLGAGSLFAGFFHLTTHAFFKALLFLCAGSYIHRLGTNDMISMGRAGAARMRVTTVGLVVGGAALAGLPPLAGFFSKEHILGALDHRGLPLVQGAAFVAAFLTAYYTFRMVFLIVRPNDRSDATPDEPMEPAHGEEHAGWGEPWAIRGPILVLVVLAIGAGFLGGRIGAMLGIGSEHHTGAVGIAMAVVVAVLGVALAWFEFGMRRSRQVGFAARHPAVRRLLVNRWYIDAIYRATIVRLALGVSRLCFATETRGLDELADGVAVGTADAGGAIARGHGGRLQVAIGVAVVLVGGGVIWIGLRS